jgi:hypothetical protein
MNLAVESISFTSSTSVIDTLGAFVVLKIPQEENVNVKASSSNLFFMFKYSKFYIPIKY